MCLFAFAKIASGLSTMSRFLAGYLKTLKIHVLQSLDSFLEPTHLLLQHGNLVLPLTLPLSTL